ncbi:NAD(P)/FAD-dependent oxidoreductase [Actinocorallia sp. API 0066]|uniref:flavin-containing monooxygenase n=1 Tax=Actinocorallia sp. API 0066 TaxID=2896846 RepID=UPI001E45CBCD|nr:NAD(P)/FAD-dependent oxidoreductase [Actinocorallia sp. API 0066]MCD0449302.1 NAD(P)/FAD-dependent oxidoreductase [Actinocorallia sp. API 0066]
MTDHEIVIVGAGFSGIGVAIKLREAGHRDFVVLDAADGIGGVWHHNVYPGIAVDIPTTTYSYSFESNPSWSRLFAPGAELKRYAEHCVDKYGLRPHLRLRTKVVKAVFQEDGDVWHVHTEDGVVVCRFLVGAVGPLDQPKPPDIPGVGTFAGRTVHTARWDASVPLDGARVAVIGTGASGLQVIPEIAPRARHLSVFQRTPIWVIPKPNSRVPRGVRALFRRVPPTQSAVRLVSTAFAEFVMTAGVVHHTRLPFLVRFMERVCLRHLERQVADPELRAKLTPRYAFGCKRPSFSSTYLPTFNRPDVSLVTDPIQRITEKGIVTGSTDPATGADVETLHEIDTLVLATGFAVMKLGAVPAFPVYGLGGVELGRYWDEHRYQNYEGISTPLVPNFWLMNGPYSVAGSSWFSVIESGSRHIVRCVTEAKKRHAVRVVVKAGPHDAYMRSMRAKMRHTVFVQPSCAQANSYYFDRHGDAPFVRPVSGPRLWWASRTFNLDHYTYTVGRADAPVPVPADRKTAPVSTSGGAA